MASTIYARYTTGATLYAKPLPLATPWGDDAVALTENGSTGSYSGSVPSSSSYEVFVQSGGSEASSDLAIAFIEQDDITSVQLDTAVVQRNAGDTAALLFTFPEAGLSDGDFTKTLRLNGGSSQAVAGTITFKYTQNSLNWYELAYDAADRPASGFVQYLIVNGSNTADFSLTLDAQTSIINLLGVSASSRSAVVAGDRVSVYKHDTIDIPVTVDVDYTSGYTAAVLIEQGTTKLGQVAATINDATTITWEFNYGGLTTEPTFTANCGTSVAECSYTLVITETASGDEVSKVRGPLPVVFRSEVA